MAEHTGTPQHPSIALLDQDINKFNFRLRHETTSFDERVSAQACHLTAQLLEQLRVWRLQNNYPLWRQLPEDAGNLDRLQSAFSVLLECLDLCSKNMESNVAQVQGAIQRLVSKSWVIEENPRQINKLKDSKSSGEMEENFHCRLRCLLPDYWGQKFTPKVAFTDADDTREQSTIKMPNFDIARNGASIVVEGRIKGAKPVKKTDRKLYIVKFKFGDHEQAVVESLPIGFYTHTTQIPIVSGYVFWFNAFTEVEDGCLCKRGFPPDAELGHILTVLNLEFHKAKSVMARSMRSTKRGAEVQIQADSTQNFSVENNSCLARMLHGESERDVVPYQAVLKDKVDRDNNKFTFWEWFYACFKTKCELVKALYEKGLVIGFITKTPDTDELLKRFQTKQAPGTKIMLLRYSMNYLDDHHAYLSPSILRTIGEPEHGRPIKSSKYKKNERNLGPVLETEMGEDRHNVHVLTTRGECLPFAEAFSEFMEETESFLDYRVLNRDVEGAESVASEASFAPSVQSPAPSEGSSLPLAASPNYHEDEGMDMDQMFAEFSPFLSNAGILGIPTEVENGNSNSGDLAIQFVTNFERL